MNIPQLDSCRFITISQIRERISSDNFQYKSVRVAGRILDLQNEKGFTVIRQPDWWSNKAEIETSNDFLVNTFLIRDKNLEVNKIYEFFGEIEEVCNFVFNFFVQNQGGVILLKARTVKCLDNIHPKVYVETTNDM